MAGNPPRDTAKRCSHAPGVGAGKPRAATATHRVEGASATATADGDGPAFLGSAIEAVDELAAFAAGGAAGNRGGLAPPGIQTLLGVEEPTSKRSPYDRDGAARADSANEPRQPALGRAEDPRRAAETGSDGLASDGVEVHAQAPPPAVAGVANVFKESRAGSDRVGFVHGSHSHLSSPVRARGAEPRPTPAGAFQCYRASDRGMDGAAVARGVRAGGGAPVSDPGPRPGLWRTIFASGQDIGHPGSGYCASLAVAKRVCRAGDWLNSTGMS